MSSPEIAKPCTDCCVAGSLHAGDPKGKIIQILDVDTYIATPSPSTANGNIVFYFSDVYGHFPNAFLLMDAFAQAGYLTFGPDFFRGDPISKYKNMEDPNDNPDFDVWKWCKEKQAFSDPFVPKFAEEIKSVYGKDSTKFACVGYCYGAPYVCDQLSDKGICSAGAFAHPAFLKESHFDNLTKPLFLSCAEIDVTFPKELRRRAVDIMDEKRKMHQVQLFHDVAHGFALRANLSDPFQVYLKDQSFRGIKDWFDLWLK